MRCIYAQMNLYFLECYRPFHERLEYLPSAVIAHDVTSGVHSCTILGFVSIAFNGKCGLHVL